MTESTCKLALRSDSWQKDYPVPAAVTASYFDPQRFCPMLIGVVLVEKNKLTASLPGFVVTIRAPNSLLKLVVDACDGMHSLADILARYEKHRYGPKLNDFLKFLQEKKVVIDAALYAVHALEFASQYSPFGMAADKNITNRVAARFNVHINGAHPVKLLTGTKLIQKPPALNFTSALQARRSDTTFSIQKISENNFLTMLWAIYGTLPSYSENCSSRRTVASAGGMYLIDVYVCLKEKVGRYEVGLYQVHYPIAQGVCLERIDASNKEVLATLYSKPWETHFSVGAIFLLGDIRAASLRYRNRATQYLFMEAGAALHNGAVTAACLRLGYSILGSYYEESINKICRDEHNQVLATALFGGLPRLEHKQKMALQPDMDFSWVQIPPVYSTGDNRLYAGWAKINGTADHSTPFAWGCDRDPQRAYKKAMSEAIERSGFQEPLNLIEGTIDTLPYEVLHPSELVKYSTQQYQSKAFPFKQFDSQKKYLWKAGVDANTGKEVLLLADSIYSKKSLAEIRAAKNPYTWANTSGCAVGVSLQSAYEGALYELIERDAFMRHWLLQSPGRWIIERTFPAGIRKRLFDLSKKSGAGVALQYLDSPWAYVCLASAQHDAKHFTLVGSAAAETFEEAAHKALEELELKVMTLTPATGELEIAPNNVMSPEDHGLLYGLKRYYRRADTVLFSNQTSSFKAVAQGARYKNDLQGALCDAGNRSFVVDITPQKSCIDQGRTRLFVVRAFVQSLIPMSFGYGLEPNGMLKSIHIDSRFPHPFN